MFSDAEKALGLAQQTAEGGERIGLLRGSLVARELATA